MYFLRVSSYTKYFDLRLYYYLLCWRGKHIDVHFRRIKPVLSLSKDGKDAIREGRNGRRGVYFPPKVAFFLKKYYN